MDFSPRIFSTAVRILRSEGLGGFWQKFCFKAATTFARMALRPLQRSTANDPCHLLFQRFLAEVNSRESVDLLEVGARARSGNIYNQGFASGVRYHGFDIIPGPNVHIVGDIHSLSQSVAAQSKDAVFCISVWEHLSMPWKAAVEINKVLKVGGLVYIGTHSTWPLHDRPWDFFRFSTEGLRAFFHKLSGFEVIEAVEGLPCLIFPLSNETSMRGMERQISFLGVGILARKISEPDPRLNWDVSQPEVLDTHYPT